MTAYQTQLERLRTALPAAAERIGWAANQADLEGLAQVDAACDEFIAHLRACAAWSERLSRLAPPKGCAGILEPLRLILPLLFGRLQQYVDLLRRVAGGHETTSKHTVILDLDGLIDDAVARSDRALKQFKDHAAKEAGKRFAFWTIIFFVALLVLANFF